MHELPRTPKGEPERKLFPNHHQRRQLGHLMWPILTRRVVCKKANHPLYSCKSFQALSHERKISVVKDSRLCVNCLGSGHFGKECPSSWRCKKCHQPHHLLLHIGSKSENCKAAKASLHSGESTDVVTANVSQTAHHKQVLLMTCKVRILCSDGFTTQARALLILRLQRRSSLNTWRSDLA